MTELAAGSTPEGPGGAVGGTPDESDLPELQGLGNSTDDPSDPQASDPETQLTPAGEAARTTGDDDDQAPSDPMPDASGVGDS